MFLFTFRRFDRFYRIFTSVTKQTIYARTADTIFASVSYKILKYRPTRTIIIRMAFNWQTFGTVLRNQQDLFLFLNFCLIYSKYIYLYFSIMYQFYQIMNTTRNKKVNLIECIKRLRVILQPSSQNSLQILSTRGCITYLSS